MALFATQVRIDLLIFLLDCLYMNCNINLNFRNVLRRLYSIHWWTEKRPFRLLPSALRENLHRFRNWPVFFLFLLLLFSTFSTPFRNLLHIENLSSPGKVAITGLSASRCFVFFDNISKSSGASSILLNVRKTQAVWMRIQSPKL